MTASLSERLTSVAKGTYRGLQSSLWDGLPAITPVCRGCVEDGAPSIRCHIEVAKSVQLSMPQDSRDELSARRRARSLGAEAADHDPVMVEQLDYCQCNRGPVIGVVHFNADRLWFFSMESHQARTHHEAADLRCVDCLADAALAVSTGAIRNQMKEVARERAAEIDADRRRAAMREGAGQ